MEMQSAVPLAAAPRRGEWPLSAGEAINSTGASWLDYSALRLFFWQRTTRREVRLRGLCGVSGGKPIFCPNYRTVAVCVFPSDRWERQRGDGALRAGADGLSERWTAATSNRRRTSKLGVVIRENPPAQVHPRWKAQHTHTHTHVSLWWKTTRRESNVFRCSTAALQGRVRRRWQDDQGQRLQLPSCSPSAALGLESSLP